MKVTVLEEHGFKSAALGFSLSYNTTIERANEILPKFAFGLPGENKFLEHIYLWLDVIAMRAWWVEADTYRLSSKCSESTMHTIMKKPLTQENFDRPIPEDLLDYLNGLIVDYKETKDIEYFYSLKSLLPEGFLQRRIWVMNYKTLQNIYIQRQNHKLPQWRIFLDSVLSQIAHPDFIVPKKGGGMT